MLCPSPPQSERQQWIITPEGAEAFSRKGKEGGDHRKISPLKTAVFVFVSSNLVTNNDQITTKVLTRTPVTNPNDNNLRFVEKEEVFKRRPGRDNYSPLSTWRRRL